MIYEHGGDLDTAIKQYGGKKEQWIDLSTGINPNSYPHGDINIKEFRNLPSRTDTLKLNNIAKISFQTNASVSSLMGAQTAINILPILPSYTYFNSSQLTAIKFIIFSSYCMVWRNHLRCRVR